jgi:UvrD-like helicase C-terminal domain
VAAKLSESELGYVPVVAINPVENQLFVEKASGGLATYDPRRLSGVSVIPRNRPRVLVGERIQFTAPDKSLGVANRDLAAIAAIHPDGRISARLDNDRQVHFNASEYRHFDHGYAVTSHSSQGLTAERVLIHADTRVHPDLLNSRFGYVSISRASHEATLYTDDMSKLGPSSEPMPRKPLPWKSIELHRLHGNWTWAVKREITTTKFTSTLDIHSTPAAVRHVQGSARSKEVTTRVASFFIELL